MLTPGMAHAFCDITSSRRVETTESSSEGDEISPDVVAVVVEQAANPRIKQHLQRSPGVRLRLRRQLGLVGVVALIPRVVAKALTPGALARDKLVAHVVETTCAVREQELRGVV